jgi:hypothetical protein
MATFQQLWSRRRYLDVLANVTRRGLIFFNVRLPTNNVFQLIRKTALARNVIRFKNHDLQFGRIPTFLDMDILLVTLDVAARRGIAHTKTLYQNSLNRLCAEFLDIGVLSVCKGIERRFHGSIVAGWLRPMNQLYLFRA